MIGSRKGRPMATAQDQAAEKEVLRRAVKRKRLIDDFQGRLASVPQSDAEKVRELMVGLKLNADPIDFWLNAYLIKVHLLRLGA